MAVILACITMGEKALPQKTLNRVLHSSPGLVARPTPGEGAK